MISDGAHRIEITRNAQFIVAVDGMPVETQPRFRVGELTLTQVSGGVEIIDAAGTLTGVRNKAEWVNVYVSPGPQTSDWSGIFGNANGEASNDFQTRDGVNHGERRRLVLGVAALLGRVVLRSGEDVVAYAHHQPPGADWTSYAIPLTDDGWVDEVGQPVAEGTVRDTLSALSSPEIRGEFREGEDYSGLDNVSLSADPADPEELTPAVSPATVG